MASSAPSTPRSRLSSRDLDCDGEPSSNPRSGGTRSRLNSAEIPRTYSGLYGAGGLVMPDFAADDAENDGAGGNLGDISSPPRLRPSAPLVKGTPKSRARQGGQYYQESNLLPFELSHNRNTDWIASGGPALLVTYVLIILVFLLTFLAFVPEPMDAWTLTNVAHGLISLVYLHWIKGNPGDYMDGTQGEMNAMTTWEQIVCKPSSHLRNASKGASHNIMESPVRGLRDSATRAIRKLRSRDVLVVVPTLLAHASCHVAKYQFEYCAVNVGVWAVIMLPKMPFMNGVRILGINRTAGIDDGDYLEEEEECFSTEEESSKDSAVGLDFDAGGSGAVDAVSAELKKDR